MINLRRTDSTDLDFIELVKQLDADLKIRDGEDHFFYAQFNKLDRIKHAIVFYQDDCPIACGAVKTFSENIAEVKRMFVQPKFRGQGFATRILTELEAWSRELGYDLCVLETGYNQPEAIKLYRKNGYRTIPNYGQYQGVENSICFEKKL